MSVIAARRRGLSLLEVMLALAILGLSLATIGELMRLGSRSAELARDMTTAQILCETKVSEIVTGMLPAISTAPTPIVDAGSGNDWLYSVETQQIGVDGLLAVRVMVQQNPELVARPATFVLVRWMIDPNQQPLTGTTVDTGTAF
jgi:type II secretion system protein I